MIKNSFNFFLKEKNNVNIVFQNVDLSFNKKQIFKQLSFKIRSKGISVIMGPNGSGKTLCLKLIANIVRPDSGNIKINIKEELNISYVSQRTIFLRRSIYENLKYVLKIKKNINSDMDVLINDVLKIVNFDFISHLSARKLSAGQQQLLSVIRGLISRPNVLLLDEPFSNLDYKYSLLVEKLLNQISNAGIKIILVTHDLIQAGKLGDDIFFFSNGKVIKYLKNKKNLKKNFFDLFKKNGNFFFNE